MIFIRKLKEDEHSIFLSKLAKDNNYTQISDHKFITSDINRVTVWEFIPLHTTSDYVIDIGERFIKIKPKLVCFTTLVYLFILSILISMLWSVLAGLYNSGVFLIVVSTLLLLRSFIRYNRKKIISKFYEDIYN